MPGIDGWGDRLADVESAKRLGAKEILLQPEEVGGEMSAEAGFEQTCVLITDDWWRVAEFLRASSRSATVVRETRETQIRVSVDLDGSSETSISTGLRFFDHMLEQIPHHSGLSLVVDAKGDTDVDEHHTIEDVAIVIGEALRKALGDKRGVERYGFVLPMDDCRASVLIDFGGRIGFDWEVKFEREMVGDFPTEMFKHFFKSLSEAMMCNLHVRAEGENDHHKAEACFKAFARALRAAVRRDVFSYELPSSKGVI